MAWAFHSHRAHKAHLVHTKQTAEVNFVMQTGKLLLGERVFAEPVELAAGFFERLRGLLGRTGMSSGSAMVIERCGSVHTVGMKFPVDLVFLDKEWQVLSVKQSVRPGCLMISGGMRARRVVESSAGDLDLSNLKPGMQITFTGII